MGGRLAKHVDNGCSYRLMCQARKFTFTAARRSTCGILVPSEICMLYDSTGFP